MSIESLTSNVTSNVTGVEISPSFCVDRPVGPLMLYICYVVCGMFGIPASLWLLWVFFQRHRSGLTNDVFMVNLTVMDLIYNLLQFPSSLNYYIWQSELFLSTQFFFQWFAVLGRPLFMSCLCITCYLAVVHPVLYMKFMRRRYKMVVCALVWIFTLAYALVFKFITVHHLNIVIPCTLYLSTIGFCDFFVLWALRKPDPSRRNTVHPQKQRAMQTITNSLVMSIVAYLPPLIAYSLLAIFPFTIVYGCDVIFPSLAGPCLGSNIMPVLYLGNLGQLKGMWAHIRSRCSSDLEGTA